MRVSKAFLRIGIDARLWKQTGVGRYLQELVENLEKIDKENQYILFLRQSEFNNFQFSIFNKFSNSNFQKKEINIRWHSFREQLLMPWILWKEHLDLVHFPYFSVAILYPGKFVVTIHDLILDHFETGQASTLPWIIYKIKRCGYKIVMWIALHRAVKIITVSQATKLEIMDHYKINPEKVVVSYEAVGADIVPPLGCERKPFFLYVGNAYPHKNLERLCQAFLEIKSATQELKLILVGPDDYFYKKLKEKVSQIGPIGQISFYGPATKEELTGLYQNAIALVFPSLMEGFGLPGVEAMTNDCLVICSDIPVFREIYGDAAIYFDPNNQKDITKKMALAMSKEINDINFIRDIKRKGEEQVKKYSWQKLARETLKVYKDCLLN